MAKKAKRRGRPPGSKNKIGNGKLAKVGKSFAKMEVGELRSFINGLESLLAKKVQEQRRIFEGHLAELQGYVSSKAAGVVRTVMQVPRKPGSRKKAAPKYQSKRDKSVKWSGRGMTPVWMREEMKGTKLKKEDFAIA
jgi:DNA-binding protein H-NS